MKMRIFLICLLFGLPIFMGECLYYLKDGFTWRRILPIEGIKKTDWPPSLASVLEQPFFYLARGRQCFAFESQDGQYVLKLVRTDIYRLPLWVRAFAPSSYRKKLQKEQKERQEFLFESFRLSLEELSQETATLAIHLGKSPFELQTLHLVDATGVSSYWPLHELCFAIQKKQPLLMEQFKKCLQKKELLEAEKILDALLLVIEERANKAILNRDRSFLRNYGYDGKRAYQIDIGSFFRSNLSQEKARQKSLSDSIDAIAEWMGQHAPEMQEKLSEKYQSLLLTFP